MDANEEKGKLVNHTMATMDGRVFPMVRMGIRSNKDFPIDDEKYQRDLNTELLSRLLINGKLRPERISNNAHLAEVLDCFNITSHPIDIHSFRQGYSIGNQFPDRVRSIAFDIDEVILHWSLSVMDAFKGIGEKGRDPEFRNTDPRLFDYQPFQSAPGTKYSFLGKIWYQGIQKLLKGRMRQHIQFHPGVRAFQLGLRLGLGENLTMATTGSAGRILVLVNEDPAMRMIYFGKGPSESVSIEDVRKAENIYTREHLVLAMRELIKDHNPILQNPLVEDYIHRIQQYPKKGPKLKHPALALLLNKRPFSILVDDSSSTFKMLNDLPGFFILKPPSNRPKFTLNLALFGNDRYLNRMTNQYVPSLAGSLRGETIISRSIARDSSTPKNYPHQRFEIEIPWDRYGQEFNLPESEMSKIAKVLKRK